MRRRRGALPAPIALVFFATLPLCACAPAFITADTPRNVKSQPIAPYEWLEECVRMKSGDRVEYAFESTDPVDFNLHYQEGKIVVMPLAKDKTQSEAGVFAALDGHDYCLTWEAGANGAFIDYRIRFRPAP